jgi:hypothetical protein
MLKQLSPCLTVILTIGYATAKPLVFHRNSAAANNFLNSANPVKRLAAVGDSYSSGIGAGNRLGSVGQALQKDSDYACSRYDHSYPYLVNQQLGDPGSRNFQFKSCSGAVISDVLNNQIPNIDRDQDLILLSAGMYESLRS